MAIEAYIPTHASFAGQPLGEGIVFTLHNAESDAPHGSFTTSQPLPAGTRGGPLVVQGMRDGKRWEITLAEIEVRNKSAVGFEYAIRGPIQRSLLDGDAAEKKAEVQLNMGNLGATF